MSNTPLKHPFFCENYSQEEALINFKNVVALSHQLFLLATTATMAGKSFEGYLNHLRYWLINYISLHISAILFQGVISSRTPTQTNEVRAMYHRTFLFYYRTSGINCQNHCMKNFQIRSFFWSVFSCIGLNTEI